LIDGEREIRDRLAGRRGLHFGILPGVPEQNDFVHSDIRHEIVPPFDEKGKSSHETWDRQKMGFRPR
jgi:hypothetical protein